MCYPDLNVRLSVYPHLRQSVHVCAVGVELLGRTVSSVCRIVMGTIRRAINTAVICCITACPGVCMYALALYLLDTSPSMSARHFLSPFFSPLLSLYLILIELFTGTFASDEEKHYAWMKGGWGGLEGMGG